MKKKTLIGIIISAVFLYIALKGISFDELFSALKGCNYLYLIPAFAITYILFVIRALRWHHILKPIKSIGFKNLFSATIIGFMANNIFPARAGEFVKANILGNDENIDKSSVFATVVIERLFDGMSLLFIVLITFFLVDIEARLSADVALNLKRFAYGSLLIYILIIAFMVALTRRYEKMSRVISACLKPFPDKFSGYIIKLIESFRDGLKLEKGAKNLLIISGYSILHWIICAIPIYIILMSFGLTLPIEAAFIVLIIKVFAVMVPAAPGYIGTLNVAVMYALTFYGVPAKPDGVSISMVVWLVDFLPPVALGFILIWFKNISLKNIEEAEEIDTKEGEA